MAVYAGGRWRGGLIRGGLLYIIDLEEGVTAKILKFADDTKLFTKLRKLEIKKLQDDIDKLFKLSEKWQIFFNFGK